MSLIFKIPITNDTVIIITVFQILSAVSLQMGKFVPPEFAVGGVAAFMLHSYIALPLSYSLIFGILASLLMIPLFEARIRINRIIGRNFKYPAGILMSAAVAYLFYFFSLLLFQFALAPLTLYLKSDSSLVIFSLLSLPFFYAIRLKSGNEPAYFILGVAFGGMLTWINMFIF